MKSKESVEKQIKMYSLLKTDNAYYLKGKAFIDLAQMTSEKSYLDKAILAYSEAIKLKQDSTYLCERAKAYIQLGLTKEAVADFKTAQSIDNGSDILKNYHVQNSLQDLRNLLGQSITLYSVTEDNKPVDLHPKKLAEIEKYNKILEKNPTKHQAYNFKGLALKDSNMYNEALDAFNAAIKLSPSDANYYVHRAEVLQLLNQHVAASEDYAIAERLLHTNKSDYDDFAKMRLQDKINIYKHSNSNKQIEIQYLLQKDIEETQHARDNIIKQMTQIHEKQELYSQELYSMSLQQLAQSSANNGIIYDIVEDLKLMGDEA